MSMKSPSIPRRVLLFLTASVPPRVSVPSLSNGILGEMDSVDSKTRGAGWDNILFGEMDAKTFGGMGDLQLLGDIDSKTTGTVGSNRNMAMDAAACLERVRRGSGEVQEIGEGEETGRRVRRGSRDRRASGEE